MNYPKYLLHRLAGVDIVKVFSLNALSTFIRMLASMISVKVVAVIIGPAGIALLGQLNNFSSILLGMANGGINSGITKYIAENKEDDARVKVYISNALRITLTCSGIVGLFLIFLCKPLSRFILFSEEYYYVYIIFGFTILLFTFNSLLISILNGYKQFKLYVRASIFGTIAGLIYSLLLVTTWGLPGALINAVTFQSIMVFVTFYMCRKMPWMKKDYFKEKMDIPVIKKYLGYSIMTFTTLAVLPVSQMILRSYVISDLSATDAGIWEGMNRISSMYLSIITTSFSVYYLPRISEINDSIELRREIIRCYKVIVPLLLGISIIVFFSKHFILWLLFTPDFYPMEALFGWQLAGDIIRMCAWLLSYILVAKARITLFITTEIVFSITYLSLCFLFLHFNGIVGMVQGNFVNCFLYLLTFIFLFKRTLLVK